MAFVLPLGFRFVPTDDELIIDYLQNKVNLNKLPSDAVKETNLYDSNPKDITKKFEPPSDKGEWYFFTPRDRKYPKGIRADRKAGAGYWKATGADKDIKNGNRCKVGVKKSLVYYEVEEGKETKTNWIMHEYRLLESKSNHPNTSGRMRLDDWVLCRIYERIIGTKKASTSQRIRGTKKASTTQRVRGTKKASTSQRIRGTKKASTSQVKDTTAKASTPENRETTHNEVLEPQVQEQISESLQVTTWLEETSNNEVLTPVEPQVQEMIRESLQDMYTTWLGETTNNEVLTPVEPQVQEKIRESLQDMYTRWQGETTNNEVLTPVEPQVQEEIRESLQDMYTRWLGEKTNNEVLTPVEPQVQEEIRESLQDMYTRWLGEKTNNEVLTPVEPQVQEEIRESLQDMYTTWLGETTNNEVLTPVEPQVQEEICESLQDMYTTWLEETTNNEVLTPVEPQVQEMICESLRDTTWLEEGPFEFGLKGGNELESCATNNIDYVYPCAVELINSHYDCDDFDFSERHIDLGFNEIFYQNTFQREMFWENLDCKKRKTTMSNE